MIVMAAGARGSSTEMHIHVRCTSMRANSVILDKLMRDALRATGLKTKRSP